VKRLTEGLIHKNFVIISGDGVGPVNPSFSKGRGMGRRHRAVLKGGNPSLKYGPVPYPHSLSLSFFLLLNLI